MCRKNNRRGFTLIELMVAMLISAIVLAAVYQVFLSDYRAFESHNMLLETQQNEKMALEFMSREIQLIGYDAMTSPITADIITAKSDYIQFEEYNTRNDTRIKILYEYKPTDEKIVRRQNLYDVTVPGWGPGTDEDFVENVTDLTITYFDDQEQPILFDVGTGAIASSDLGEVRRIEISMTVRTPRKDPIRKIFHTRELNTSFYVRNLGLETNLLDTTPPDPPINISVTDPMNCGELDISWDANTEKDLAGYAIYLNLESATVSPYTEKILINNPDITSYTITGLDFAPSNDPASLMYYIAMSAFDKSLNMSEYSVEVNGDGFSGDDTIPNPNKPAPPENFTGEDVPGEEGKVKLSWVPSSDLDIDGYRLYRSGTPITTFPVSGSFDPSDLEGLVLVADEATTPTTLGPSDSEFVDEDLIGCKTYYYAIAAVNCDETLITDDAGDDDTKRYISSDYRFTSGDGTADPMSDTPSGADTTPGDVTAIDSVPYPVPDIASKAGWRRVFLSITNPNRSDDPDFSHTEVYFSDSSFPVLNTDGTITNGTLLPDGGGVFTAEGTLPPIIFDSPTVETPSIPELDIFHTYYFFAVSFDLCGNASEFSTHAITLSELCGDDPDFAGAPPIPSGLDAEGCSGYARLEWDHQGTTVVDLAGYHVYRSEGSSFDLASSTELTGGAPQWFDYFVDSGVTEGGIYSYGIRATDCIYENIDATDPNYATVKANNISDPATLDGIMPGKIQQDNTLDYAISGEYWETVPSYYHNTVTFFIENTSAGPVTIQNLDISWENSLAYLSEVYIGSSDVSINTSVEKVFDAALMGGPRSSGSNISISKTIYDYGSVGSGSIGVPVVLVFTDSLGSVNTYIDMREDLVDLSASFVNESMPTPITCGGDEYIYVPQGPSIVGVAQDKPSAATSAWPVPGPTGSNPSEELVVPGGLDVAITAKVYDNSSVGISDVTLYYYTDTSDIYDEITGPPVYDGSNYNAIDMFNVSGSLYRTVSPIPYTDDSTTWYFIVATDNQGNFDRAPEIESGAYNYYQQRGDVCNNTPENPENLAAVGAPVLNGDGTYSVTLNWTAPTLNTDGSSIGSDLLGYNLYRSDGSDWVVVNPSVITATGYTDTAPADLSTIDYSYYVTALDLCEPTPNESDPSNLYTECVGAASCSISLETTDIAAGETFDLAIKICALGNDGTAGDIIYIQDCSDVNGDVDSIRMLEDGDTGLFYIDDAFYGRSPIHTYLSSHYPGTPLDIDLKVDSSDTITIGGYDTNPFSSITCEDWKFLCSATVNLIPDPCDNIPSPPSGLEIYATSSGGKNPGWVKIRWTAPADNTDGSALTDLGGYKVYRSDNGNPFTLIATLTSGTTNYYDTGLGKLNKNVYKYYVTSYDTCEPTANESLSSNIVTE